MLSKLKVHYYRIRYWIRYKEKLDDGCTMGFFGINENVGNDIDVEYNKYLEEIASRSQPNSKSIDELIRYLVDKYKAEKYEKDRRLYNMFFLNTRQDSSKSINEIKTTDDILKWLHKSKTDSREFFKKIELDLTEEIERSQFKPHFFKLKLEGDNSKKYGKYGEINIEEITKSISMKNIPEEIRRDIIVYFGVSDVDISIKSNRFMRYTNALRDSDTNKL